MVLALAQAKQPCFFEWNIKGGKQGLGECLGNLPDVGWSVIVPKLKWEVKVRKEEREALKS